MDESTDSISCTRCGRELAPEHAFCSDCGQERADHWSDRAGFVDNGRWWRPASEFVRRIDLDEMREGLLRASVLIPDGSIGVVSVDGEIEEILRPGKRTTVTWLDRLSSLFTEKLDRTAFYLIDLRPIPIPIRFEMPVSPSGDGTAGGGTSVEAVATLVANVDRSSRNSLATFVQAVVRERKSLSQKDLHALLAAEVGDVARRHVVASLRVDPDDFVGVAARVASMLNQDLGTRLGLHLDLLLDLRALRSIDLRLGVGEAPAARYCVTESCGAEMAAAIQFCPACGGRQPMHARRCSSCGASVRPGNPFCTDCGERWTAPAPAERPLFTADGEQVELDLVVRIQGQTDESTIQHLVAATASVVAAELRHHDYSALASRQGFEDLTQALSANLGDNLPSLGVEAREVAVLDLRAKSSQWLLDARADLDLRRQQLAIGRDWLASESAELDLRELTWSVTLRRRQMRLAERFAEREAELAERHRQEQLDDRETDLDVRAAERRARLDVGRSDAERSRARHQRAADHQDALAAEGESAELADQRQEHELPRERQRRDFAAEGERLALDLESEKRRRAADDRLHEAADRRDLELDTEERREKLQLDKLRRMTELNQQLADAEHGHEMERRGAEMAHQKELTETGLSAAELLALQASDLAGKEHGEAAFAALEGARVAAAQEASRGEVKELMQGMAEMQQRTIEAALANQATASSEATRAHGAAARQASSVAERSIEAMADVRAASAAPAAVVAAVSSPAPATACRECGQDLVPPYRFCGRCGIEQAPFDHK